MSPAGPRYADGAGVRGAGDSVAAGRDHPRREATIRLTGRFAYASLTSELLLAAGRRSIEFNEAATEVVVPNGRKSGSAAQQRHQTQVTRQILGYREQQASSESSFILTATIQ